MEKEILNKDMLGKDSSGKVNCSKDSSNKDSSNKDILNKDILIEASKISKRFGVTIALDQVDLVIRRGEIHGLIGENGSGKSTISSIISGMQKADSGTIKFQGNVISFNSMIEAINSGIGMIVQESGTIPGITVAENLFIGEINRFKKHGFLNRTRLYEEAQKVLDHIGAGYIQASSVTAAVDYQDRKLIEVARVIHKKPEVLIIDETTTVLSQFGRDIIYGLMKEYQTANKAVIFISHDLDELMKTCNILTVLRDGHLITSLSKEEFEEEKMKQLMVGRELQGNYYRDDYGTKVSNEVVLSIKQLSKKGHMNNISFDLHKGEILGIGGLSHCGMHTLGKCIFGFVNPDQGEVVYTANGKVIRSEKEAMRHGLGYVSKDRDIEALSLNASIRDNISIAGLDKIKNKLHVLLRRNEKRYVSECINEFSIKCRDMDQYVSQLSGGNKQKVVFGKWISRGSSILILDCPTRGIDIGVKQAMYQLIYQLKQEGKSFIIISEELSELIGMSDRILIMKNGEVTGSYERDKKLTESEVIGAMI